MERQRTKSCVRLKKKSQNRSEKPRLSASAQIPVEEVVELFRCGRCQGSPIKPPVYTCRSGHLTCTACYDRNYRDCPKCKDPLTGRNHVLEEVVRGLPIQTCTALNDCSVPAKASWSDQSLRLSLQDPSHLEKLERARMEAERHSQEAGDYRNSSTCTSLESLASQLDMKEMSHRPVTCPYPCGRIFTCSGIFPHFEFHHPKVFLSTIRKDQDIKVVLKYNDILRAESRCLMLFVVRLDDRDDNEETKWAAADLLRITRSSREMVRNGCFISALSVGRLTNPLASGEDGFFLAAWGTCLYKFSSVSYTLSASNENTSHSVSYTGPLVSMHESQRPADVYARGECLLIPPGLLKEMQFDQNSMKLTATFHSSVPFPFLPEGSDSSSVEKNLFDF